MGKRAQRKRQATAPVRSPGPRGEPRGAGGTRRWRTILLYLLPVFTVGGAFAVYHLLGSRPGAGIVGLLGLVCWIVLLTTGLAAEIPRRDRTRASGLNFGR